jgi:predicted AlkP superfamily phosphohydrolase/phosphomutase
MDVTENNNRKPPKLVVLGWDAATWDLLTPWIKEGHLPNLVDLMENGAHGSLHSTPLPVSPAAWTTIITGKNPAKHNIYDWFSRNGNSYDVTYVNTGQIMTRTMWDYINDAGLRIGVFNLPMVYPATPVDGFMLSGLAAPNPTVPDFGYPRDLVSEIEEQIGPYWHAETEVYKYGREQEYFENVLEWTDYQNKVIEYLLEHHACDVYCLVFMQTDHIQHKFWRYMDETYPGYDPDKDDKFKDAILYTFQQMDKLLGKWISSIGGDTQFLLLSDHGAGPVHGVMYINRWLAEKGYLHLRQDLATNIKLWLAKKNIVARVYNVVAKLGLGKVVNLVSKPTRNRVLNSFLTFKDIDWTRTKAYARGSFGQIFINLKGREPHGIVDPELEYDDIIAELLDDLRNLRHPETGERLITDIHKREDVYSGPYLSGAADIMFSIQDYLYQSSVKMGLESASILGLSEYGDSSSHRPEGVFVMAGPGIRKIGQIQSAQVTDILPTILALLDVPIPTDLDGKPIMEALTLEQKKRVKWIPPEDDSHQKTPKPALNPEEIQEIEARLRDLGYLG